MSRLLTRRQLLAGAGAMLVTGCDRLQPMSAPVRASERFNRAVQQALFRRGAELHAGGAMTSVEQFPTGEYMISRDASGHRVVPTVPDGWRLKIGGKVKRPLLLTLDDLMRMPRVEQRIEHHCVEGWSAIASWHGVRISDIAERAGADDCAYVEFRSFDRGADQVTGELTDYWSSWDRDSAMHPQSMLAYGMNDQPLSPAHGAPVRLYGAVKLGYKNVKWLTEVNFLDEQTGGYWEHAGYEWFAGT